MSSSYDPEVEIEARGEDWIIYRRTDGLRWKVTGKCDRRGHCWVGGEMPTPSGPHFVKSVEDYQEAISSLGEDWLARQPDVPVGPNFTGCCPFVIEVLSGN